MEIVKFSDNGIQDTLKNLFQTGGLIPIIGSGFSKGSQIHSNRNKVLDGFQLIALMKDMIERYAPKRSERVVNKEKFSDIAKEYLKSVPREVQLQVFSDYFVDVNLDHRKSAFLKAGWSYIYTLNIDDGIERVLRDYNVVLPFKKLNADYTKTHKCIYKLHGDAKYEITYQDEKNLIFSSDQYLISLRDNADFISMIQSDYKTKSILIIGCSLDDELDIKFAVLTNDKFDNDINHRFYIAHEEPNDEKKEILEDLGISKIVLVENYDEFYDFFSSSKISTNQKTILEQYRFKGYTHITSKEDNINYYLGQYTIENTISKYKVMIEREKQHTEWNKLKSSDTILLIGRRITGKTTFLINLLAPLSSNTIYFFSSQISVSADFVKELESLTNSIFIFDSNSIQSDNLDIFNNFFKKISDNNNKLIVAANKSDRLFIALFNRMDFDLCIEIDKFPTVDEVNAINSKTAEFGIPNISDKNSFIDNIAYLNKTIYKNRKSVFPQLPTSDIQSIEAIIFILLASVNKVYYITFQHFSVSVQQLREFAGKYAPAVELYNVFSIESNMHSGIKLVANSRYWIINVLANICQHVFRLS